jgi:7-cyano-7-deazaguanine synthase
VPSCVAAFSGGLDSTTLAYGLRADGWDLVLLSVDYGQRHRRELDAAAALAASLPARHHVVDVNGLSALLVGSALTDSEVAVPHGHYTDHSMRATVVPNRNAILLSMATAVAIANSAEAVACAVHAGDHAIYPDCRPEFIAAFEKMVRIGNEGFIHDAFRVLTPFLTVDKAEIVREGHALGVPFAQTWSCYEGGAHHCGRCGTCVERKEAFVEAGVADPTVYEDALSCS